MNKYINYEYLVIGVPLLIYLFYKTQMDESNDYEDFEIF
jgi:hypothetical protein